MYIFMFVSIYKSLVRCLSFNDSMSSKTTLLILC